MKDFAIRLFNILPKGLRHFGKKVEMPAVSYRLVLVWPGFF